MLVKTEIKCLMFYLDTLLLPSGHYPSNLILNDDLLLPVLKFSSLVIPMGIITNRTDKADNNLLASGPVSVQDFTDFMQKNNISFSTKNPNLILMKEDVEKWKAEGIHNLTDTDNKSHTRGISLELTLVINRLQETNPNHSPLQNHELLVVTNSELITEQAKKAGFKAILVPTIAMGDYQTQDISYVNELAQEVGLTSFIQDSQSSTVDNENLNPVSAEIANGLQIAAKEYLTAQQLRSQCIEPPPCYVHPLLQQNLCDVFLHDPKEVYRILKKLQERVHYNELVNKYESSTDNLNQTLLGIGILKNRFFIVQQLLNLGASPNQRFDIDRNHCDIPPLFAALIYNCQADILSELLDKQANIQDTYQGQSVLTTAIVTLMQNWNTRELSNEEAYKRLSLITQAVQHSIGTAQYAIELKKNFDLIMKKGDITLVNICLSNLSAEEKKALLQSYFNEGQIPSNPSAATSEFVQNLSLNYFSVLPLAYLKTHIVLEKSKLNLYTQKDYPQQELIQDLILSIDELTKPISSERRTIRKSIFDLKLKEEAPAPDYLQYLSLFSSFLYEIHNKKGFESSQISNVITTCIALIDNIPAQTSINPSQIKNLRKKLEDYQSKFAIPSNKPIAAKIEPNKENKSPVRMVEARKIDEANKRDEINKIISSNENEEVIANQIIKLFMQKPSDTSWFNTTFINNRTIFHLLAIKNKTTVIKKLLEHEKFRALAQSPDKNGCTILHYVMKEQEDYQPLLTLLLTELPQLITMKDKLGNTALQVAVMNHRTWAVKYLLNYPDAKERDKFRAFVQSPDKNGRTILHHLVKLNGVQQEEFRSMLRLLQTELPELLNKPDKLGNTPLHTAVMSNQIWAVISLVKCPTIKKELLNNGGKTALDIAADNEELKKAIVHVDLKDTLVNLVDINKKSDTALTELNAFLPRFTEPRKKDNKANPTNQRALQDPLKVESTKEKESTLTVSLEEFNQQLQELAKNNKSLLDSPELQEQFQLICQTVNLNEQKQLIATLLQFPQGKQFIGNVLTSLRPVIDKSCHSIHDKIFRTTQDCLSLLIAEGLTIGSQPIELPGIIVALAAAERFAAIEGAAEAEAAKLVAKKLAAEIDEKGKIKLSAEGLATLWPLILAAIEGAVVAEDAKLVAIKFGAEKDETGKIKYKAKGWATLWSVTACQNTTKKCRQFDLELIHQQAMGLLSLRSVEDILEDLIKLYPHFDKSQKLVANYLVMILLSHSQVNSTKLKPLQTFIENNKTGLEALSPGLEQLFAKIVEHNNALQDNILFTNYSLLNQQANLISNNSLESFDKLIDKTLAKINQDDDCTTEVESIAAEFRALTLNYYKEVTIWDFTHPDPDAENKSAPRIARSAAQFNALSNYFVAKLLKSPDDLVNGIKLLVALAQASCRLNGEERCPNLNHAMLINSILNNANIDRLKKIYIDKLSTEEKETIEQLKLLTENRKNYQYMRAVCSTYKAALPYSGVIQGGITFAKDGNPEQLSLIEGFGKVLLPVAELKLCTQFEPSIHHTDLPAFLDNYQLRDEDEDLYYASRRLQPIVNDIVELKTLADLELFLDNLDKKFLENNLIPKLRLGNEKGKLSKEIISPAELPHKLLDFVEDMVDSMAKKVSKLSSKKKEKIFNEAKIIEENFNKLDKTIKKIITIYNQHYFEKPNSLNHGAPLVKSKKNLNQVINDGAQAEIIKEHDGIQAKVIKESIESSGKKLKTLHFRLRIERLRPKVNNLAAQKKSALPELSENSDSVMSTPSTSRINKTARISRSRSERGSTLLSSGSLSFFSEFISKTSSRTGSRIQSRSITPARSREKIGRDNSLPSDVSNNILDSDMSLSNPSQSDTSLSNTSISDMSLDSTSRSDLSLSNTSRSEMSPCNTARSERSLDNTPRNEVSREDRTPRDDLPSVVLPTDSVDSTESTLSTDSTKSLPATTDTTRIIKASKAVKVTFITNKDDKEEEVREKLSPKNY